MPQITIPAISSGTANPADVMSRLYLPDDNTPVSLEAINGWLDKDNLASGEEVQHDHLQPGAVSRGGQVGSNTTLDYFGGLFDTALTEDGASEDLVPANYVPVPGGCITGYIPFTASRVVITWNLSWTTDGNAAGKIGAARFMLDGLFDNLPVGALTYRRVVPPPVYDVVGGSARHWGDQQHWSGHAVFTGLPRGWYTFGLGVASTCTQVRIRNRSIRYIAFK